MKATINELWETGRNLISFENDEFERPTSFSELKKCENVLIGDKIEGTKMREVLIDDQIVLVDPTIAHHPTGCGKFNILEVI